MSFEPLRHILSRSIKANPASTDLNVARVMDAAQTVIEKMWGEERAAYVRALSFREGVLKFETTSPAAKQELAIDTIRLKNEINRQLGSQAVKTITVQSKGF
ncbi:MAG: DciA family protein [Patescibacteria group bacterium]